MKQILYQLEKNFGINTRIRTTIQSTTSWLIGEYGWMFLAGLLVLFFKTSIESLLSGLLVFVGNDYNNDDIILLDGRPQNS